IIAILIGPLRSADRQSPAQGWRTACMNDRDLMLPDTIVHDIRIPSEPTQFRHQWAAALPLPQKKRPWLAPGPPATGRSECRVFAPNRMPSDLSSEHDLFRKPVSTFRDHALSLLHGLAVQREVEAFALHLVLDAQPDHDVDDLEDDQRHHEVVHEDGADA